MYEYGLGPPRSYAEAMKWYRKSAAQGNAHAQFILGGRYAEGRVVAQDYGESFKWSHDAAVQGHPLAQFNLAAHYLDGKGVPQDDREAFRWYEKSAQQGFARAKNRLGWMYTEGRVDGSQDHEEAFRWYLEAAEQGLAIAQHNVGVSYDNGWGVPQDEEEAAKWYHKASEQGYVESVHHLGLMAAREAKQYVDAADRGDVEARFQLDRLYKEVAEAYRQAAEGGSITAQVDLGGLYAEGRGVPRDYAEAVRWFRRAHQQGDALAEHSLKYLYAQGQVDPESEIEEVTWNHYVADEGNPEAQIEAQFEIGEAYANGRGVPTDRREAASWYLKAAEQGHTLAQSRLGAMYRDGQLDGSTDGAAAADWFRRAADGGDADAMVQFALLHLHGQGVRQDHEEAAKWFREAAKWGHAEAKFRLASLFSDGLGVAQDHAESARLYLRAAEEGHPEARLRVGDMYYAGKGFSQDYVAAAAWYHRVIAEHHHDPYRVSLAKVRHQLGKMYADGLGVHQDDAKAASLFWESANAGDANAQFDLGVIYASGKAALHQGTSTRSWCKDVRDPTLKRMCEVRAWFWRSASQGHKQAQFELGQMFEHGIGGIRSLAQAYKWYNLAGASYSTHLDRVERMLDRVELEDAQKSAEVWRPKSDDQTSVGIAQYAYRGGSGFWVGPRHVLTNYHVVATCRQPSVPDVGPLRLIESDEDADLALLSSASEINRRNIAIFRQDWGIEVGDEVVAAGYPAYHAGAAELAPVVTFGHVSATPDGDRIQISAALFPGNSGGPILDESGNVVAVAVSSLRDDRVYELHGALPQLVNFAISPSAVREFIGQLDFVRTGRSDRRTRDVAELAKGFTVPIMCL